jgi:hypothetical protein
MRRHLLAATVVLGLAMSLVVSTAGANVRLIDPPPRSAAADLKSAPCGNVAKNGAFKRYASGEKVTVQFEESVGSQGCYQIAFARDGANFTVLQQLDDPSGSQGAGSTMVTLPSDNCDQCVLQLRQISLGGSCADAGQVPDAAAGDTFYSCADVCLGSGCPALPVPDAGMDAGMGASSSGGPVTTRPDSGEEPPRTFDDAGGTSDGCSFTGAGVPAVAAGGLFAFGFLALVLRANGRKSRKRDGSSSLNRK